MRIALVGAEGFVGSAVRTAIVDRPDLEVSPIVRGSYEKARREGPYDILINAAMPSKRFWAKQNPDLDFVETVEKTHRLLHDWQWEKFVQISSISARSQLDTVYGRHKAAAEKLCGFGDNLILRLGPMYGSDLDKGVLIDLMNNDPVYVAAPTRYCYAPVEWVGNWLVDNLWRHGTVDIGGRDAVPLKDVAEALESTSDFLGPLDDQIVGEPIPGAPAARDVIDFARALRSRATDVSQKG